MQFRMRYDDRLVRTIIVRAIIRTARVAIKLIHTNLITITVIAIIMQTVIETLATIWIVIIRSRLRNGHNHWIKEPATIMTMPSKRGERKCNKRNSEDQLNTFHKVSPKKLADYQELTV